MKNPLLTALAVSVSLTTVAPQAPPKPKVHRLEATPDTVAYGYYDAAAKPVLRIASGDLIDVDTLLTSTPDRLEKAGVPPSEIQQSLRDIVSTVKNRGPGGHILTGPVFVEGAEPGDALEVRVVSIDLTIPYGYNGCRGFLPENCGQGSTTRIIRTAYQLTSIACDVSITQLVDGKVGVHVKLPKNIFKEQRKR